MKRVLAVIISAALLFGAYWFFFSKQSRASGPKQQAIKIGKHSDAFNKSVLACTGAYLVMKDAFVGGDTLKIKSESQQFIQAVGNLQMGELKKDDSTILMASQQEVSDIRVNAEAILTEKDLQEMRQDFRMVSENLYPFLKTIAYQGPRLYWLNCPNAFGENMEGTWLSDTAAIINPYLGATQPPCSETKDSL